MEKKNWQRDRNPLKKRKNTAVSEILGKSPETPTRSLRERVQEVNLAFDLDSAKKQIESWITEKLGRRFN